MREKIAHRIQTKLIELEPWELTDSEAGEIADAVLDALMEPTEGMIGAFHRMCDDNGACLVKPGFQAMIRAAKEGK